MYTYWDEELGSYLLTKDGKKLTERDMINVIGELENSIKDLKPINNIEKEDKNND